MSNILEKTYNGKKVLVTGHTGFKGSWLAIWLTKLGADVVGFSLEDLPTDPCNFELANLKDKITDVRGDIRNIDQLKKVMDEHKPEVVFHLAAQPILIRSYEQPKETFDTNSGGTVNILEAVKNSDSVKALVCITTDKVYKNNEWEWGYREVDKLGDHDPYAASKAMAELAIESYRESFMGNEKSVSRQVAVASVRAGNVIGGGDFADYRLIPDCVKAMMEGKPIELRNPAGVRPWMLVLEPLSGYLMLGAMLLGDSAKKYTNGWNFGPLDRGGLTAEEVVNTMIELWGEGSWIDTGKDEAKKESNLLMLDWSKAQRHLGWEPIYNGKEALGVLVGWYKEYAKQKKSGEKMDMYDTCIKQIEEYTEKAGKEKLKWSRD
jgi:CDP-glucose 4,6-dehydratase